MSTGTMIRIYRINPKAHNQMIKNQKNKTIFIYKNEKNMQLR